MEKTVGRKRKTSAGPSDRQLDELIAEATVDAHDEDEQASGFFNMIDEYLAVPFQTRILGIDVSVVAVEMDDDGGLKAVCEGAGKRQRIGLLDLRFHRRCPPAPSGSLPT